MTKVSVKPAQSAIVAMYAGLALTVATLVVPYIDHATANVLAGHIRAGYPTYSPARIDTAVTTYLVYVSIIGALASSPGSGQSGSSTPGSDGRAAPRPRCSRSQQASRCSISSSRTPLGIQACHRCSAGSECCHAWPGF